jgi:hypothetical protein
MRTMPRHGDDGADATRRRGHSLDSVPDVRAQTEAPRGDAIADWRAAAACEARAQRMRLASPTGMLDGLRVYWEH